MTCCLGGGQRPISWTPNTLTVGHARVPFCSVAQPGGVLKQESWSESVFMVFSHQQLDGRKILLNDPSFQSLSLQFQGEPVGGSEVLVTQPSPELRGSAACGRPGVFHPTVRWTPQQPPPVVGALQTQSGLCAQTTRQMCGIENLWPGRLWFPFLN